MPRFRYKAINPDGKPVSGELEAADVRQAAARLEADGLTVDFVRPADATAPVEFDEAGGTIERMKVRDFRKLSGHLGDLAQAGLPLAQGLRALAEELPRSRFRRGLESVIRRLEAGDDLADVLNQHGAPADVQALIAAGAKSGQTGELLGRYAAETRQSADIRLQAAMALAYPLITLIAVGLLLLGVMAWIVPMFRTLFADFGTELPALTEALLVVSDIVVRYGLWLLAGAAVLTLTVWIVIAFVVDKLTRRRLVCAVPVLGRMARYTALSRFSSQLATLVESGVPLPAALTLSGESTGDAQIETASWLMAADVEAGEPLDRAAYNMPAIPAMLVEALRWHDKPALFAEALRALADLFETRTRAQTGIVVALWQPLIIVVMGCTLGLTVIALFMPLIQLLNDLS